MAQRGSSSITPLKLSLIIGSVLASLGMIVLSNTAIVPLALGDFFFFSALVFLCALYRPRWAFLFFVALIPLESINLAPIEIGVMLRPYQWLGIIALAATFILAAAKRLPFSLPKIRILDGALAVMWIGSVLTALVSADRAHNFKQSLILLSFLMLYALTRIFVRKASDLITIGRFFMGGSLVVAAYALWQNIRFAHGLPAFEVMPGRPNSVFTEPDWLGAFIAVSIAVLYALLMRHSVKASNHVEKNLVEDIEYIPFAITERQIARVILVGGLVILYGVLIVSVARSAWLATAVATIVAWTMVAIGIYQHTLSEKIAYIGTVIGAFGASIALVAILHLTTFQLSNRAQSTTSGLQRITVACEHSVALPEVIESADQLRDFSCRHIMLEEKETLAAQGAAIQEVYRHDPNVSIRRDIYAKAWRQISEHPFFGIGFFSIHTVLGEDERGAGLNTSNAILEIWLGSGIIGLAAFGYVWFMIGWASLHRSCIARTADEQTRTAFVLIVLIWTVLSVFNMFNAGLLLGFVWMFVGVAASLIQGAHKKY